MELPPAGTPPVDRIGVTAAQGDQRRRSGRHDRQRRNAGVSRETASTPVGRVIEILGHPDDFGVDVEIIIRKHHIPHQFPARGARAGAEPFPPPSPRPNSPAAAISATCDIVTIDGETARDFDDAVWVDRLPNGNYALHVHIADVSHYVRPGTPIDREARLRGTSVYFPDRAVPMLPSSSPPTSARCVPQEDRLVLSALLEIDHHGDVVGQEFTAA